MPIWDHLIFERVIPLSDLWYENKGDSYNLRGAQRRKITFELIHFWHINDLCLACNILVLFGMHDMSLFLGLDVSMASCTDQGILVIERFDFSIFIFRLLLSGKIHGKKIQVSWSSFSTNLVTEGQKIDLIWFELIC